MSAKNARRRRMGCGNLLTDVETETLIREVKARPSLWDDRHEDFKQFKVSKKLWAEVGADMNMPGEETKKKWKNLKDKYRKVLQAPKRKTKKGERIPTPWRFADSMYFTREVLLPSVSQANGETEDERKRDPDNVENEFSESNQGHDYDSTTQSSPIANPRIGKTQRPPKPNRYGLRGHQEESTFVFEEKQPAKRKATRSEGGKPEALLTIQTKEKKTEEDDDYYFLMSLHPFLKPLPPFEKLELRGRLLTQVMEKYKNHEQQINESPHAHTSSETCQIAEAEPISLTEYHRPNG